MKIKNKFLAGAFLTLASLGIVGSITGTYAWYSYNTKDPISYHGIASGNSKNLQVKMNGEETWKQSLTINDLVTYSQGKGYAGQNLTPVSFKETQTATGQIKDFYGRPETYTNKIEKEISTKGADGNKGWFYCQFDIRAIDPAQSTGSEDKLIEQDVYISDLRVIAKDSGKDVSSAVRLYLTTGTSSHLVAPGVNSNEQVVTNLYGKLKSDGVNYDKGVSEGSGLYRPAYDFDDPTDVVDIEYGVNGVTESALPNGAASVAKFEGGTYKQDGFKVCTTSTTDPKVTVTMIIYLQGWDESIKDSNVGAEFDFGMTLECN